MYLRVAECCSHRSLSSNLPARVITFLPPLTSSVYTTTCQAHVQPLTSSMSCINTCWWNLDFLYQMLSTWKCKPAKRQKTISSFLSLEKKLKAYLTVFWEEASHYVPCGFWQPHFVVVYSAYEAAESSERVCDSQYSTEKLNLGTRDTRHTVVNFLNSHSDWNWAAFYLCSQIVIIFNHISKFVKLWWYTGLDIIVLFHYCSTDGIQPVDGRSI